MIRANNPKSKHPPTSHS